jgi:ferredoxin
VLCHARLASPVPTPVVRESLGNPERGRALPPVRAGNGGARSPPAPDHPAGERDAARPGEHHQGAGRGFDARISTEYDVTLPDSACVYCGNCIGVCPTGALMPASEYAMRQAGTGDESEQTVTSTVCPYCGVGCNLDLHVQDNTIVKVTSPWCLLSAANLARGATEAAPMATTRRGRGRG